MHMIFDSPSNYFACMLNNVTIFSKLTSSIYLGDNLLLYLDYSTLPPPTTKSLVPSKLGYAKDETQHEPHKPNRIVVI